MPTVAPPPLHCPLSKSADVDRFFEVPEVPVQCNALYQTRIEAVGAPTGDLELAYAPASGHIYNAAFDPDKITYSETYENSLHHSPRFQAYATNLADRLIESYDLQDKTVVDIGCGNGEFLELLCERGGNTGVGYDPSYEPDRDSNDRPFTVVQDVYSEAYADRPADFICCRHVLEHVPDPLDFAKTIRRTVGDDRDTVVYVEVPNALFTLREVALWDLIYEHCSYFTPASLTYLFRRAGFDVLRIDEAFNGQYLQIELAPGTPTEHPRRDGLLNPTPVSTAVDQFAEAAQQKRRRWTTLFSRIDADDERTVLWGAGSKGVTILNVIDAARKATEYIVDINPKKQGMHVAGTGHKIVAPSFLKEYRPDRVVLMNGIYEDEIRQTTAELGLDPEFVVAT